MLFKGYGSHLRFSYEVLFEDLSDRGGSHSALSFPTVPEIFAQDRVHQKQTCQQQGMGFSIKSYT